MAENEVKKDGQTSEENKKEEAAKDCQTDKDKAEKTDKEDTAKSEETEEPAQADKGKKDKKSEKAELKKLRAELEETKKALEEQKKAAEDNKDKYLRLAAEYDNFRKRSAKEKESVYGDAVSDAVKGIIPIIDNLQIAYNYRGSGADKFAEGVEMILSKLPETLEKLGVKQYGAVGDKFDPKIHNAVMHIEDDSYGENEIIEVFQVGYLYGDKMMREAMVKVAN